MKQQLKIRLSYDLMGDLVNVYIFDRKGDKVFRVKEVVMEEVEDGIRSEPAFTTTREALNELPNDLDQMGLKPTSQNAQKGELAATKYHLEDMRKLAKLKK